MVVLLVRVGERVGERVDERVGERVGVWVASVSTAGEGKREGSRVLVLRMRVAAYKYWV